MSRRVRNFPKIREIEINKLSIKVIAAVKATHSPPPASSPIKDPRGPDPNQSSGDMQLFLHSDNAYFVNKPKIPLEFSQIIRMAKGAMYFTMTETKPLLLKGNSPLLVTAFSKLSIPQT